MPDWVEAGGKFQVPFLSAAGRLLDGEYPVRCPRCDQGTLRAYFHVFNRQGIGTMWTWCPRCHTTAHLPRVKPVKDGGFRDPFENLNVEEFAAFESGEEAFLDRLDRLWEEGSIRPERR